MVDAAIVGNNAYEEAFLPLRRRYAHCGAAQVPATRDPALCAGS